MEGRITAFSSICDWAQDFSQLQATRQSSHSPRALSPTSFAFWSSREKKSSFVVPLPPPSARQATMAAAEAGKPPRRELFKALIGQELEEEDGVAHAFDTLTTGGEQLQPIHGAIFGQRGKKSATGQGHHGDGNSAADRHEYDEEDFPDEFDDENDNLLAHHDHGVANPALFSDAISSGANAARRRVDEMAFESFLGTQMERRAKLKGERDAQSLLDSMMANYKLAVKNFRKRKLREHFRNAAQ
ncbi:unnamed protein product [Amoebophrya sp. A25]|nr:unnamed protein product [Amoebophrya sp. A25]|eukprot:GSA25T00010558001.1